MGDDENIVHASFSDSNSSVGAALRPLLPGKAHQCWSLSLHEFERPWLILVDLRQSAVDYFFHDVEHCLQFGQLFR